LVFSCLSSEIVMTDNAPPNPVPIGVGIDTARYGHHVSFLDEQKRTAAPPFHFTEAAESTGSSRGPVAEQLIRQKSERSAVSKPSPATWTSC
jgi:hypothetical protein